MSVQSQVPDGVLPDLSARAGRPFGVYIHVPFCATRCGYCDFNTYTPGELGGANPDGWLAALRTELRLGAARLRAAPAADIESSIQDRAAGQGAWQTKLAASSVLPLPEYTASCG